MKNQLVLNTQTCKVFHEKEGLILYMKMKNGGWVKNNAYKADLQGLIGALTLGIDVLAGKVWPTQVVEMLPGEEKGPKIFQIGQSTLDNDEPAFLGDGE